MSEQITYQEFREQYEQQHPASVPTEDAFIGEYPIWVTWAVGLMFMAAAFFSGVHTIPIAHDAVDPNKVTELLRQVAGLSAFAFVEAGILVSAYMLVKRWSLVMFVILLITIIVAMGANLYSVSKAFQPDASDTFSKAITILFGLVAPLVAALSGGVFVWLHQSDRIAAARSTARFKEAQIAWDKEIKKAFDKQVGASNQPSKDPSNRRSLDDQPASSKPVKSMDASERVRQHLDEHPEDIEGLSSGKLASMLGVSKATANNVQRQMRTPFTVTNGNGKPHRLDD